MYPFTKVKELRPISPKLDKNGRVKRVSSVDQFDAQDFMLGENGFKRSDISAYFHAEDQRLRDAILARMQEVKLPEGYPADTPVGDIIDSIVPAYCKTSAQVREFVANMKDIAFDKAIEKFAPKKLDKSGDTIDFANTPEVKSE